MQKPRVVFLAPNFGFLVAGFTLLAQNQTAYIEYFPPTEENPMAKMIFGHKWSTDPVVLEFDHVGRDIVKLIMETIGAPMQEVADGEYQALPLPA